MAQVRRVIEVCDRCGFGKEKPATEERTFALEDRHYLLKLCQDHADAFDRDLGKWTLLAEECDGPPKAAKSQFFTRERVEETRRARELAAKANHEAALAKFAEKRAAEIAAQERIAAEVHARKSVPGAFGWRLTTHAAERMQERGFTVREVLEAAAQPETIYRQPWRGPHVAIHQHGDCRVVVDEVSKAIITVIDRSDTLELSPPLALERRAQ